jgi:hypothetical protein
VPGATHASEVLTAKLGNLFGPDGKLTVLNSINRMAYSDEEKIKDFAAQLFDEDLKSVYDELLKEKIIDSNSELKNTKATADALTEIMKDWMFKKEEEQIQQKDAKLEKIPSQGDEGSELDLSKAEGVLNGIKIGLDYVNPDTSTERHFFFDNINKQLDAAFGDFKNQYRDPNNENNDLPPPNTPQEKSESGLKNGVEALEYNDVKLFPASGVEITYDSFGITLSNLIEGLNAQVNYVLPSKKDTTTAGISAGIGLSWNKDFEAYAGSSLNVPINKGSLEISSRFGFNIKTRLNYGVQLTGSFSY